MRILKVVSLAGMTDESMSFSMLVARHFVESIRVSVMSFSAVYHYFSSDKVDVRKK